MESIQRRLVSLMMICMVGLASVPASAEEMLDDQINNRPSALAMFGDAIIARPMLLALTTGGLAVFLVTLPFSALGRNMGEAGKMLVVGPAKATFLRCLGCTATQDEWKDAKVASHSGNTATSN